MEGSHFVDLGGGVWHMINLTADASKMEPRSKELYALFDSMKYG